MTSVTLNYLYVVAVRDVSAGLVQVGVVDERPTHSGWHIPPLLPLAAFDLSPS